MADNIKKEEPVYCNLDKDGKRMQHRLDTVSKDECQRRQTIARQRREEHKAEKQTPEYKRAHFGEQVWKEVVIADYKRLFPDSTESNTVILKKIKQANGFDYLFNSATQGQKDAYFKRARDESK